MAIDGIREGNPDLEFGVAPIPGGETSVSVAGGEILAVAENEKKEYAIRFLKFLADKDRMKEYIDAFGFLAPASGYYGTTICRRSGKENIYKNVWSCCRDS
ncbi:MAG: hypothetical protein ACLR2O_13775 [Coprococcus sp.]